MKKRRLKKEEKESIVVNDLVFLTRDCFELNRERRKVQLYGPSKLLQKQLPTKIM